MALLRVIFLIGGRAMTGLIAGFGLAFDYSGKSFASITSEDWGIIGLIAFGVFVILTVVREIDLLIQSHPKIFISPIVQGGFAILNIRNIGDKGASFSARAKILEGHPMRKIPYNVPWQDERGTEHFIKKNDDALLLIAKIAEGNIKKNTLEESTLNGELELCETSNLGAWSIPLYSSQHPYPQQERDLRLKFKVEIAISSEPPLKRQHSSQYIISIENNQLTIVDSSTLRK